MPTEARQPKICPIEQDSTVLDALGIAPQNGLSFVSKII
jgi:hypothetical protein